MSQEYKLRFGQMKENNPAQPVETTSDEDATRYQDDGHSRNLSLVKKDGTMFFYSYAYMIGARFEINQTNTIILQQTSCTIKIQGYGLQPLFWELFSQRIRIITETDERYAVNEAYTVTEIVIEENVK